jgi:hypothetical protein
MQAFLTALACPRLGLDSAREDGGVSGDASPSPRSLLSAQQLRAEVTWTPNPNWARDDQTWY